MHFAYAREEEFAIPTAATETVAESMIIRWNYKKSINNHMQLLLIQ